MTKVLRAEDGLADWAVEYAKQRGVPTAEVVSAAIRAFREDASRGVPDLEPVVRVARDVAPREVPKAMGDRQRALNKRMGW